VAKTRSGLGRGLSSLLYGAQEEALPQETPSPVERIVINSNDAAVPAPPARSTELPPETPVEQVEEVASETPAAPVEPEGSPAVYSNKEDNVTIKGVVERQVARMEESVSEVHPAIEIDEEPAKVIDEIDIDLIIPNPDQPRTNFKKEELDELSESIKKNGLLQPILVRKIDGNYQIIAGERRWQACKLAGLKTVPVRVKDVDDDETIILALIENIQRSDLNPIEEA